MRRTFFLIVLFYMPFFYLSAQQPSDPVTGTFTDSRDGKTYQSVKIGDQTWMAENLAYLPLVFGPSTLSEGNPLWYVYGYDGTDVTAAKAVAYFSIYGVLYNWPAALTACPEGWHLPSDAEWSTLTTYLGGLDVAGGKMKEAGTVHWNAPNEGATNESGFSGLPGGILEYEYGFKNLGNLAVWWSSTEHDQAVDSWARVLGNETPIAFRSEANFDLAINVRCIRDDYRSKDTLSINLQDRRSLFSSNVVPDSINLRSLFKRVMDEGKLVKIQDESGNSIEDVGAFGDWIDYVGDLSPTEGYRIELNDSVNIQIVGKPIEYPFEIPLKAGWNIIGYPRMTEMDGKEVVRQLIDRQTLIEVQDGSGNRIENIGSPGDWVNNIGTFKPGNGYKVRVNSDEVLVFGNLPPYVPLNPTPSDFAMNVLTFKELRWNCTDPEGDEMTYDVYLGNSPESLLLVKDDHVLKVYDPGELQFGTVYYWKVVARDSHGNTTEGPVWNFTVENETAAFTDTRDNITYSTVRIGNQWWMAGNLAYLPTVSPPSAESYTEPYYYVQGYSGTDTDAAMATANYATYGVLYNWPAAMTACPSGWHLPSDAEWKQLEMALGMTQAEADEKGWRGTDQGTQLKATSGWDNSGNGTNSSGFAMLPGGNRYATGYFRLLGTNGYWWSSSENSDSDAWFRNLYTTNTNVYRYYGSEEYGYSVRCVRD